MSLKQFGGVFGRNPTFNDVTIEGDLTLNGNIFTGLDYQGTWNASTNTPTLTSSTGITGEFYIVSVAGTTDLDGITNWGVGDWAMFNGTAWQRIEGGANGNFVDLTVTGNATLTNLTASTALALDASKNIVSITNTGTGNNVLATSPTLTTPNIGAATATSINGTTIPASKTLVDTDTAQTLTNKTLSTGTAITAGTINGAAIGGSTPAAGAFTTLSATGDVTIPDKIIHAGDTDTSIRFPAADTVTIETNGSERVRADSAGNVGIGVINITNSTGFRRLAINDTSGAILEQQVAGVATGRIITSSTAVSLDTLTATPLTFKTNSIERMRIDSSGGLITKPQADGHAVFNEDGVDADFRIESDTDTHAFFVDGGISRVGINNSTPTVALDVTGSLAVSGAITEASSPVVVQADIGTAANEIPLNQYLGSMAYTDYPDFTRSFLVSELPAAGVVGRIAHVTDADDDLDWGDALDDTGSNDTAYLVWDNGTNWTVAGK
jgi:hypothetical protein